MVEGKFQQSVQSENVSPTAQQNSLFNVNITGLKMLLERKLDFNGLYLLYMLSEGVEVVVEDPKVKSWQQRLFRKGYISHLGNITLKGKLLLREVATGVKEIPVVYEKKDDPFEKWWSDDYPATDQFEYNGRLFIGTQSKHEDKEGCRKLYWEIINEGIYTTADISRGTTRLVENAKIKSLQTGESELRYIPNSKRFLQFRKFIPFVNAGHGSGSNGTAQNQQTPSSNQFNFDI